MSFTELNLHMGDVIIAKINVGELPAVPAKKYLETVKDQLQETFGKDQRVMLMAVKNEPTQICVVHMNP